MGRGCGVPRLGGGEVSGMGGGNGCFLGGG